ncbi:MAG: CDP-diacylglycerol--glycerol-3-phosphate 3-phosphatidyltransferase [Bifidobacteriaceae bacterium]|nr:CDP-diacylglycerol--glycerol-3-phosphate 3-phosphatidyltransferase [Bifidobacteriaceae bacterium]
MSELPEAAPAASPPESPAPPRIANVANVLTLIRIALVPAFVVLFWYGGSQQVSWRAAAVGVFLLAALTDRWDGHLARSRNLVTNFGKIADPIADKALIGAALICLSARGELHWSVTGVVLGRELIVTLVRLAVIRRQVMAASQGGKLKTVTQVAAIAGYLLPPEWLMRLPWFATFITILMIVAVAITVATGADYILQARAIVKRSRPEPPASASESQPAKPAKPKRTKTAAVVPEPAAPSSSEEPLETSPTVAVAPSKTQPQKKTAGLGAAGPEVKPPVPSVPAAKSVSGSPAAAEPNPKTTGTPVKPAKLTAKASSITAKGAASSAQPAAAQPPKTAAAPNKPPDTKTPPASRPQPATSSSAAVPAAATPASDESVKPSRSVEGWPEPGATRSPLSKTRSPQPIPPHQDAPEWRQLRTVAQAKEKGSERSAARPTPAVPPKTTPNPRPAVPRTPTLQTPKPTSSLTAKPVSTPPQTPSPSSAPQANTTVDEATAAAQARLEELKRRIGWKSGPTTGSSNKGE